MNTVERKAIIATTSKAFAVAYLVILLIKTVFSLMDYLSPDMGWGIRDELMLLAVLISVIIPLVGWVRPGKCLWSATAYPGVKTSVIEAKTNTLKRIVGYGIIPITLLVWYSPLNMASLWLLAFLQSFLQVMLNDDVFKAVHQLTGVDKHSIALFFKENRSLHPLKQQIWKSRMSKINAGEFSASSIMVEKPKQKDDVFHA